MKTGDLVNFHAKAWIFDYVNERYTNPGVIINVRDDFTGMSVYTVLWADGKATNETLGYLETVR